jgi:hypothetical protein
LEASSFLDEMRADRDAAQSKFGGKIIEVTGTLDRIHRIMHDPPTFAFYLKAGPEFSDWVICNVEGYGSMERAQPGQVATLRGELKEAGDRPYLHRGAIVRSTGPPCLRFTTAELAARALVDGADLMRQLKDKHIFVTGIVGSIVKPNMRSAVLVREGRTEITLLLDFTELEESFDQRDPAQVPREGEPFSLLVQVSSGTSVFEPRRIVLVNCIVVATKGP